MTGGDTFRRDELSVPLEMRSPRGTFLVSKYDTANTRSREEFKVVHTQSRMIESKAEASRLSHGEQLIRDLGTVQDSSQVIEAGCVPLISVARVIIGGVSLRGCFIVLLTACYCSKELVEFAGDYLGRVTIVRRVRDLYFRCLYFTYWVTKHINSVCSPIEPSVATDMEAQGNSHTASLVEAQPAESDMPVPKSTLGMR